MERALLENPRLLAGKAEESLLDGLQLVCLEPHLFTDDMSRLLENLDRLVDLLDALDQCPLQPLDKKLALVFQQVNRLNQPTPDEVVLRVDVITDELVDLFLFDVLFPLIFTDLVKVEVFVGQQLFYPLIDETLPPRIRLAVQRFSGAYLSLCLNQRL